VTDGWTGNSIYTFHAARDTLIITELRTQPDSITVGGLVCFQPQSITDLLK